MRLGELRIGDSVTAKAKSDPAVEQKMHALAEKTGLTFDGSGDNRLFADDELHIDVYANLMSKQQYAQMEKEIKAAHIKGKGYEVYAWNDVSGYNYWKEEGEDGSGNYIQITATIKEVDKVDAKKLISDVHTVHSKLEHWDNKDEYWSKRQEG
jgi:hypothetical protein